MKRLWTLISATAVLLAASLIVFLTPTAFVLWSPGDATVIVGSHTDENLLSISGRVSYPVSGDIVATSRIQSGQDAHITLPMVINGFFRPDHDVLPHDAVYTLPDASTDSSSDTTQLTDSVLTAPVVAALRQAGVQVTARPLVSSVRRGSPADGLLYPGDFIVSIDNVPMDTDADVRDYIRSQQIGNLVEVGVERAGRPRSVVIEALVGSPTNQTVPSMGAVVSLGYTYAPTIDTSRLPANAEPQGLAVALATYDLLTSEDSTQAQMVAAVGVIGADGSVSRVSAIDEHAASAANAGADILLIPVDNCADLTPSDYSMTIAPVVNLRAAIDALTATDPPRCPQ